IAVPSTRSSTKRPPSAHLLSAVPVLSSGGFAESIHIFVATVNEPTIGSSFLWASPGVPAAIQAFVISSWLGMPAGAPAFEAGFGFSFAGEIAVPARAIVTTEINRRCFIMVSSCFVTLALRLILQKVPTARERVHDPGRDRKAHECERHAGTLTRLQRYPLTACGSAISREAFPRPPDSPNSCRSFFGAPATATRRPFRPVTSCRPPKRRLFSPARVRNRSRGWATRRFSSGPAAGP